MRTTAAVLARWSLFLASIFKEELFSVLGPNSVSELFFPDNFYFKFSLALKCQTELSMWELWHHSEELYVFEVQHNVFTALEDSCLKTINKYIN